MEKMKMQVREKVGKSRNTVFSIVLWLWRVEKWARDSGEWGDIQADER